MIGGVSTEARLRAAHQALAGQRHEHALQLAEEVTGAIVDRRAMREAHRLAMQAAFFLGRQEAARRHGIAALGLANERGEPLDQARAHNDLAVVFGSHGLFEHALNHLWQAIHATEAAGTEVEGGPLNNLGNVYLELERTDEAMASFERAAARFEAAGDEAGAAIAKANIGRVHTVAGRGAEAVPALDEALEAFERLGRMDDVVATHAKLGLAHAAAGAPYHARRAFELALELHEEGHGRRLMRDTHAWFGAWALHHGDLDTAVEQLRSAERTFDSDEELASAGVLEPLSRALEAAGRPQEALAALRRQLALDEERRRSLGHAARRIRLLELELGTEGEQEIARLRTVELEMANDLLREETARLEALSTTDSLTGLFNRRALERRVGEEVAAARRHGATLVLALVDLDEFKAVNDTFGHETGDLALRRLAELLTANVRASDVAARWGGEEFALLLPNTRLQDARHMLERVGAAIAGHRWSTIRDGLSVTTSIGAAGLEEVTTLVELLRLADRRLYAAKAAGRDRTVVTG